MARMFKRIFQLVAALVLGAALISHAQEAPPAPLAHFHHVHLNSTDPAAAIAFYTAKFDCEKARFAGLMDGVWAQKSWLLFSKTDKPPKTEITSAIWHIGWGAENMQETYQKQLDSGTKFATPITDISDIGGGSAQGVFFYAYVDGPDHQLIEMNTANHHHFGHIHMLSKDPIAAGEWYIKEFGLVRRGIFCLSCPIPAFSGLCFERVCTRSLDVVLDIREDMYVSVVRKINTVDCVVVGEQGC